MDCDGLRGERFEVRNGRVWMDVGSVEFRQMWDRLRLVIDIDAEPAEWEFADALEELAIKVNEATEQHSCPYLPEA